MARSEERTAQEFKALRELMQAGFAAVDKRFYDKQDCEDHLSDRGRHRRLCHVVAGVSGFVALTFPDQWLGAIKATLLFTGVILGSLAIIGAIAGIVTLWQHIEQKIDEREEGR